MSSEATSLTIVNNTPFDILRTKVTETDNFDWDGASRPDNNFQGVSIAARSRCEQREELNSNARSAWYRMELTFTNGDVVSFRADQMACRGNFAARALPLDGAAAAGYLALQVAGPGRNCTIAISPRVDAANWVSHIPGHMKLSEMTIPGTHDTAAFQVDQSYLEAFAKCQTLSLRDQLHAGIRFLDIRCRHYCNSFLLYHGIAALGQEFGRDVWAVCRAFLIDHPQETIIMSVKEEGDAEGNAPGRTFASRFDEYCQGNEVWWYREDRVPTLQEVRGKIVLVRRFDGSAGLAWSRLNVQDDYDMSVFDAGRKLDAMRQHLDRAHASADANAWFINFSSATGGSIPKPDSMAQQVNPGLGAHLVGLVAGAWGTIVMDFPEILPDNVLIQKIISLNPLSRERASADRGPILQADQYLEVGQYLRSRNGKYILSYESTGELVLRREGVEILWRTNNPGPIWRTYMQSDGNFVVYSAPGQPLWAANNNGGKWGPQYGGSIIDMQDDANLVVYAPNREVLWASNTWRPS